MNQNDIKYYSILENTRMLFSFIEELDRLFCHCNQISIGDSTNQFVYNGTGGLAKRKKILQKEYEFVMSELANAVKGQNFLWQNTLSRYLRFWNVFYKNKDISNYDEPWWRKVGDDEDIKNIAQMLHLFRTVRALSDANVEELSEFTNALPYLYEDICLTIKELMGGKTCGLLYQNEVGEFQTVSIAGYVFKKEAQEKFTEYFDFAKYNSFKHNKHKEEFAFDCYCVYSDDKYTCREFKFPMTLQKNTQEFYLAVIFDKEDTCEKEEEIYRITKLLFVRDSMMRIISRDYATLLNFRYDYSYVRPINEAYPLKLVHISDLHAKEDATWAQDGQLCCKTYKSFIREAQECELLGITGDIVDFSISAYDARQKYNSVQQYLTKLAIALWGSPDGNGNIVMSHDWKKRVIITTGNHDYLAVNELRVVTKDRKTQNALPANTTDDNALVKFTYFLQFLQNFLDAPIKELAQNDLNECRKYRYLNICAWVLNSNSLANSLQNNKVGFAKTVGELIETHKNNVDLNNIIFVHHGPLYKIDYIKDIYEPWKIRNWENKSKNCPKNKCKETENCAKIVKMVDELINNYIDKIIKKIIDNFSQEDKILEMDELKDLQKCFDECKNLIDKMLIKSPETLIKCEYINWWLNSTLYKDLCTLCVDYGESPNEFLLQLFNNLHTRFIMQEKDNHKFKSIFKKIIPSESKSIAGEHYLVLCGHEHRFAKSYELTFHNVIAETGQKSYNLITLNNDPNPQNAIDIQEIFLS